jgi:predicted DNA-binding protein
MGQLLLRREGGTMAIHLTRKAQDRLNEYAARTGQTTHAVATEAINYFWENYGEIMADELDNHRARKARKAIRSEVIAFPGSSRPA